MSYTRAELLTYVGAEHSALLSALSLTAADTQAGVKSILDRSFRALSVGESDLATATTDDDNAAKLEAAANYYTYDRAVDLTAPWVAISLGGAGDSVSKSRQQAFAQLRLRRDELKAEAEAVGVTVDSPAYASFSINLDFLEPDEDAA
jgi:hypothetical protein